MSEIQPISVSARTRHGLLYGLGAYGLWGVVPLYFKALAGVSPIEVLCHRIIWSVVILAVVVSVGGRWSDLALCLRTRATIVTLAASTVLIAANWFVYLYGVATHRVVHTSLGYFILPLVNVIFGMLFFHERLRPLQWVAVALAVAGVCFMVLAAGELPWIALSLALTFGFYGLLRKRVAADSLLGLSVETMLLLPFSLACLGWLAAAEGLAWSQADFRLRLLLVASGLVTTVPLFCFGQAARLLPLSTLGFFQYFNPSIQLLIAVLVFGEPFTRVQQQSFACIWIGLALFSFDSYRAYKQRSG